MSVELPQAVKLMDVPPRRIGVKRAVGKPPRARVSARPEPGGPGSASGIQAIHRFSAATRSSRSQESGGTATGASSG